MCSNSGYSDFLYFVRIIINLNSKSPSVSFSVSPYFWQCESFLAWLLFPWVAPWSNSVPPVLLAGLFFSWFVFGLLFPLPSLIFLYSTLLVVSLLLYERPMLGSRSRRWSQSGFRVLACSAKPRQNFPHRQPRQCIRPLHWFPFSLFSGLISVQ